VPRDNHRDGIMQLQSDYPAILLSIQNEDDNVFVQWVSSAISKKKKTLARVNELTIPIE
jgi:hypothetical protein